MLFKKKKLDEAKECFTKALLLNSVNESAMNGLTSCQLVSVDINTHIFKYGSLVVSY
jgi:hypothetical protein